MSHSTLQQLLAGELTSEHRLSLGLEPLTRLQISAELTEFPREILTLADSIEILDLSNNQLNALPDDLHCLRHLKILFLSNNDFEQIPKVVSRCPNLEMISFKSNCLTSVAEDILPIDTRWLILTDNKIAALPKSMGQLHRLQKLALAGNRLTKLPASMADCHNLELARLSANQLNVMPDWLFTLPKLSWLAFSGNQAANNEKEKSLITQVALQDIELGTLLGEGASGLIYQGDWLQQPESLAETDKQVAVKIFKGDVTSDGYPQDELDCCLTAGEHPSLIKVIAQLDQSDEEKKLGLVMELIPASFYNLGLPPSLVTCTRDTFKTETTFELTAIVKIVLQMAQALEHLHGNGISHGDVYAHNTMINKNADALFGDFGAATNLQTLSLFQQQSMEKVEVRAWGCLLDDLLPLCTDPEQALYSELSSLAEKCLSADITQRPSFHNIIQTLQAI